MSGGDGASGLIELSDYRARTAAMFADARRSTEDHATTWATWHRARHQLLDTHPQSAFANGGTPPQFWPYDISFRTEAELHEADVPDLVIDEGDGISRRFGGIGEVRFLLGDVSHSLPIYWADSYGGGWFLPFRDETNGESTFGSGRYVLDGAKSADLGTTTDGNLIVDFNYAFHPSCVWGDWLCPLPHRSSRLNVAVTAGEQKPKGDQLLSR